VVAVDPVPRAGGVGRASGAAGVSSGSALAVEASPLGGSIAAGEWPPGCGTLELDGAVEGVPVTPSTPALGEGGHTARTISAIAESPTSIVAVSRIRRMRGSGGCSMGCVGIGG
jgi:hypothetical protein